MEQNRLLIMNLQECTWMNFGKEYSYETIQHKNCKKYSKQQSNQYNDTKDIEKLQI